MNRLAFARPAEGCHVELQLRRSVAQRRSDRAGVAREAATLHAGPAGSAGDMTGAGRRVKSGIGEGVSRTSGETGLIQAAFAGRARLEAWRQVDCLCEQERRTVSVPQPILRMDQDAQGRWE